MSQVKAIPDGYHTVTPHLVVRDAAAAIEFYKKAFNAEEVLRMPGSGGQGVMHAEIRIGNSMIMMCDEMPQMERFVSPAKLNGTTVAICLYVPDCDKAFAQALSAGAKESMPLADMFWGDRYGTVTDPFGHEWEIATHKKDLTPEEIGKAGEEFFKSFSCDQ